MSELAAVLICPDCGGCGYRSEPDPRTGDQMQVQCPEVIGEVVLWMTPWCETHDSPKMPKELCQAANAMFFRFKWLGEPDRDFGCVESSRLVSGRHPDE